MTVMRSVLSRGACAEAEVMVTRVATATVDRTAIVIRRMIPHKDCRLRTTLQAGPGPYKEQSTPPVSSWRPVARRTRPARHLRDAASHAVGRAILRSSRLMKRLFAVDGFDAIFLIVCKS